MHQSIPAVPICYYYYYYYYSRVLQISSDRDDQRIFFWGGGGGVEIFSSRILGGLEIWQVLYGWFDLSRDFLGYSKQSEDL